MAVWCIRSELGMAVCALLSATLTTATAIQAAYGYRITGNGVRKRMTPQFRGKFR